MSVTRSARSAAKQIALDAIVEVAIELIDDGGYDALTMRALADRCGMGVMTLYGYVRTKDDILVAVADRHLADLEVPDSDELPWQEQVAAVFRALRQTFHDHAELAPILATHSVTSTASFRGVEVVLRALDGAGLDAREAAAALHALRAFTTGFSQREIVRLGSPPDHDARVEQIRALPAADFAFAREAAGYLAEPSFEDSLQLLISGIEHRLADEGR